MTDLHWNTISPAMKDVLSVFGKSVLAEKFYLAGGTALALQLGHRQSIDLDYFSKTEDIPSIRQLLENSLQPYQASLADQSWGNLIFLVNSIRIGFFGYGYPLVKPLIAAKGCKIASIADIGLMKMDAILGRASRKDFHDLYAICQIIQLSDLLKLAPTKFPGVRDFEAQILQHLIYFKKADVEPPVPLLQDVAWETVKVYFLQQVKIITKSWY